MNKVILIGRLTRDPDIRYSQGNNAQCIAKYTLAVDRRRNKDGEQEADFISCIAFGKGGEFAEKYLHQGTKIAVVGRIQTGSYTNKDGQKVYTTDVIVDEQEFAQSVGEAGGQRSSGSHNGRQQQNAAANDGFMSIPDDIDDAGLPWNTP